MAILTESSGGDKTIEEQLQLRRVFRRLAFDLPLQRIEGKLQVRVSGPLLGLFSPSALKR
jgi:hypothetical protein